MFWRRRKPDCLIDPSDVGFGSVIDNSSQNLSRSHVRVKYHHQSEVLFVPLAVFIRRCHEAIQGGQPLGIDHLIVAPIIKQRYATFFDRLTSWGPAARRAYSPLPAEQRSRSCYQSRTVVTSKPGNDGV
jgi:hypothetical protein